jgi:hypothetical protein
MSFDLELKTLSAKTADISYNGIINDSVIN